MTIIIYSLANGNLRKRKTPDEKMHILLLYILKYAGVDSNILQNRKEYDWWIFILDGYMLFLYQRDCVITSNYAKRGIYHLSDAKMKELQMPDFNSY